MEKQKLDQKLKEDALRCIRCKLIIPFTFKKGNDYTVPSFTLVDGLPVCYSCYHKEEFSSILSKRKKSKMGKALN